MEELSPCLHTKSSYTLHLARALADASDKHTHSWQTSYTHINTHTNTHSDVHAALHAYAVNARRQKLISKYCRSTGILHLHTCAHVHECTVLWQQVCPLHTTEVNQLLPLSQEKQLKRFLVSATSASVFLPKTKSRTPNPHATPTPAPPFILLSRLQALLEATKGRHAKPDPLLKKGRKKTKRSDYCDHTLALCIPPSMCTHSPSQCWNTGTYRQRQVFRQGFVNSSNLSDHLIAVRAEGRRTFAHLSFTDKQLKHFHYKNRQECVI